MWIICYSINTDKYDIIKRKRPAITLCLSPQVSIIIIFYFAKLYNSCCGQPKPHWKSSRTIWLWVLLIHNIGIVTLIYGHVVFFTFFFFFIICNFFSLFFSYVHITLYTVTSRFCFIVLDTSKVAQRETP